MVDWRLPLWEDDEQEEANAQVDRTDRGREGEKTDCPLETKTLSRCAEMGGVRCDRWSGVEG
jgi:hypothetical protein